MSELDRSERRRSGEEIWPRVIGRPTRDPAGPFDAAVLDFVAAEVWARPGLSIRDRRWISLACTGASGMGYPVRTHVEAALKSGDISLEELEEFVLHFAVYAGWPKASLVNQMVVEVARDLTTTRADPSREDAGNAS
jgi:4-carboxymuconolactone decarboxylase